MSHFGTPLRNHPGGNPMSRSHPGTPLRGGGGGGGFAFRHPPAPVHSYNSFAGTPRRGGSYHSSHQGWDLGSENHVNRQAPPSVYGNSQQGSSLDLSSIGSLSQLSFESKSDAVKENMDNQIFVPEITDELLLNKKAFSEKSEDCNKDPSISLDMCRQVLKLERSHPGLKTTRAKLEAQEQIYNAEEKVSTDGIKEIDGTLEADGAALQKDMATLTEEEEEDLRLEKAKHEQACQAIKARYEEARVQRRLEKLQRERDLQDRRNELQKQRAQTQKEKFTNLTLAKAKLMAFDTGVELFTQYADVKSKNDPTILSDITNNHQKLHQLQDHVTSNATKALEKFIWGDDIDVDH
jgi:hypothetical protein